jgi:hypothetical protein
MAVIEALRPITHPRTVATSPTMKVTAPIIARAITNAGKPLPILAGGIIAKTTFQPMVTKFKRPSPRVTSSTIRFSSSIYGPSLTAFLNWEDQDGSLESEEIIQTQKMLQYFMDSNEPSWSSQFKNAVKLGP